MGRVNASIVGFKMNQPRALARNGYSLEVRFGGVVYQWTSFFILECTTTHLYKYNHLF